MTAYFEQFLYLFVYEKTWTIEGTYRYEEEANPVQKTNKTIGAIGSCAIGIILNG